MSMVLVMPNSQAKGSQEFADSLHHNLHECHTH